MMIEKVKEMVKENIGQIHSFRFKGSRNQIDEFDGIITDLYQAIFIIHVVGNEDKVKSFSYSDILTENLEILN